MAEIPKADISTLAFVECLFIFIDRMIYSLKIVVGIKVSFVVSVPFCYHFRFFDS